MRVSGLSGKDLIIRDLKKKIRSLETEKAELNSQLDGMERERNYAWFCLEETRKSFSYRLGYALTAIPRKLKRSEIASGE